MTNVAKINYSRQSARRKGITWLNEVGEEVLATSNDYPMEQSLMDIEKIKTIAYIAALVGTFIAVLWFASLISNNDFDTAQMTESYMEQTITGKSERQMALDSAKFYGN